MGISQESNPTQCKVFNPSPSGLDCSGRHQSSIHCRCFKFPLLGGLAMEVSNFQAPEASTQTPQITMIQAVV
jgi:hypothetical protein